MIEKKDKELINNNLHLTINQMVDFFNKKYTRKEIKNFLSNNNIVLYNQCELPQTVKVCGFC